jgi:hypothetical protein
MDHDPIPAVAYVESDACYDGSQPQLNSTTCFNLGTAKRKPCVHGSRLILPIRRRYVPNPTYPVSSVDRIRIHLGYALDTYPGLLFVIGYFSVQIRVSHMPGLVWIRPKTWWETHRRRGGARWVVRAEQDDRELDKRRRGAEEPDGEFGVVQRRMMGCSTGGAEELGNERPTGDAEGHKRRRFSKSCP